MDIDSHKVWLIVGITIAILAVAGLVLYPYAKEGFAGQAIYTKGTLIKYMELKSISSPNTIKSGTFVYKLNKYVLYTGSDPSIKRAVNIICKCGSSRSTSVPCPGYSVCLNINTKSGTDFTKFPLIRDLEKISMIDTDGDLYFDDIDNCPTVANADQKNSDSDNLGDACDTDDDNDDILDTNDVDPLDASIGSCVDSDNTYVNGLNANSKLIAGNVIGFTGGSKVTLYDACTTNDEGIIEVYCFSDNPAFWNTTTDCPSGYACQTDGNSAKCVGSGNPTGADAFKDVNGDNQFDETDSLKLAEMVVDAIISGTTLFSNFDFNCDGVVDEKDALLLGEAYVVILTEGTYSFPVCGE